MTRVDYTGILPGDVTQFARIPAGSECMNMAFSDDLVQAEQVSHGAICAEEVMVEL